MALMAGDNKWRDEERRINKRDTCALRSHLRKKRNHFPLVPSGQQASQLLKEKDPGLDLHKMRSCI
jgi:hypothetical protein